MQGEVERVVRVLQERRGEIADAMVEAIQAEIPPYGGAPPSVVEDVRTHCFTHAGLILEVSGDDRLPRRDELGFAREAAQRAGSAREFRSRPCSRPSAWAT